MNNVGAGRQTWWRRLLRNAAGVAVLLLMGFPLYWMVTTAFKPGNQILRSDPIWFPTSPTIDNFTDAMSRPYFWSSIRNSLVVVVTVVLVSLVIAFLASVAVARFKFRGRSSFIVMIIIIQMIPLNALIIPIYLMLQEIGQTNRLSGVILTYLTFVLPFTIWTLRGFVLGVPIDLEEAAMVDGCSRIQAFWRVVFPLIAPGLVATSVFAFIQAWNEYVIAYVLLNDQNNQTVTVWLASFTSLKGTEWGPLMAASTLTSIPVIVFFVLVHKRIAGGLTAGAVKG